MKKRELWKLLLSPGKKQKKKIVQKKLFYNNDELKNFYITWFRNPKEMYKIIRNIHITKDPQVFYVRNQRAYNTYLFKSSYDILLADKNGKILDIKKSCESNYISPYYKNGWYVYFFPIGSINYYQFKKNNLLMPGIMILKDFEHIRRF